MLIYNVILVVERFSWRFSLFASHHSSISRTDRLHAFCPRHSYGDTNRQRRIMIKNGMIRLLKQVNNHHERSGPLADTIQPEMMHSAALVLTDVKDTTEVKFHRLWRLSIIRNLIAIGPETCGFFFCNYYCNCKFEQQRPVITSSQVLGLPKSFLHLRY
jgi:hypothetical protein